MEKDYREILIVIPMYNEENYIKQCLDAVVSQDYPNEKYGVVVVDNGSTDRSIEYVKKYKNVDIIKKNDGTIASVRNSGAKIIESEYIAFLDGDSVPEKGWLKKSVELLSKNDDISCVGYGSPPPSKDAPFISRVWSEMCSTSKYNGTTYVNWLSSYNLFVKRNMFDKINGFDETLETCEDVDFGSRLNKISKLIYSDNVKVRHLGVVTSVKEFFFKELWRGKNNLKSFKVQNSTFSDFLGIVIPVIYLVITVLSVLSILFDINEIMILIPLIFVFPLILTIRKINKNNIKLAVPIVCLYSIYLWARGVSVVKYLVTF